MLVVEAAQHTGRAACGVWTYRRVVERQQGPRLREAHPFGIAHETGSSYHDVLLDFCPGVALNAGKDQAAQQNSGHIVAL